MGTAARPMEDLVSNSWTIRRMVAAAALGAALFAGHAQANVAADDVQTCVDESGDVAIAACTRAIASGQFRGDDLAGLYQNRAIEYKHKGDLDRALADYAEAIVLSPSVGCYVCRGIAWMAKGDLVRAIADLDQAIKLNPKYVKAYYARGIAWNAKGDHDRAIADYSEAIRLDPKYAAAYYNRGIDLERKGDLQRALADFKKFTELDSSDPDGRAAVARVAKALNGG